MLIPPDTKPSDEVGPDYHALEALDLGSGDEYPPEKEDLSDDDDEEVLNEAEPQPSTSSTPLHGPAISFHIYKSPGYFNSEAVVKSEDKQTVEYYMERPWRYNKIDLTLHAGSKTGPRIATMLRNGWSHSFKITMLKDDFVTTITWNIHGVVHRFAGRDGKKMMWRNDQHVLTGDWVCRNAEDPLDIAARWRRTPLARKKQGKLNIMPNYIDQTDLILATGLAVEEWGREIRRQRMAG